MAVTYIPAVIGEEEEEEEEEKEEEEKLSLLGRKRKGRKESACLFAYAWLVSTPLFK